MVSCETDSLTSQRRQPQHSQRLLPWAALALVAATCLVGVAMLSEQDTSASSPEATQLMQMWNRPFTTSMLWNAAHDSQGSYGSSDSDDSSNDYTEFDTYGHNGGSGGDMDSDLKAILPSSELKGDGLSHSNSHEWDTSELADTNWGHHSSDSSWGDSSGSSDNSWLGTNDHAWDSSHSATVKAELRKMYRKGVNHLPKNIAQKAEKEASSNFFGKWAKIAGKKMATSGKKYGLDSAQAKLYKEAEASEQKEEAKKAKYITAVKTAATKAKSAKKDDSKTAKAKHESEVKLKLKAADKVASSVDKKKAEAQAAIAKKKAAEGKEPAKDAGFIGDKNAIHKTLAKLQSAKDAKSKKAAEKRMAALEEQIKSDFNSVTSFAHKVKTSLPPLAAPKD